MANTIAGIVLFVLSLFGGAVAVKWVSQARRDRERQVWRLTFPAELDPEQVIAYLWAMSGTLKTGIGRIVSVPTMSFELWKDKEGTAYRMRVPWKRREFYKNQLMTHVPGIRVVVDDRPPKVGWTLANEVGLTNTQRTLRIRDLTDTAHTFIAATQTLHADECLLMQWVVTPAIPAHKPVNGVSKTSESAMRRLFVGNLASRDEVDEKRTKLDEPNYQAVLRVAAKASTKGRAQEIIDNVKSPMYSIRGASTKPYRVGMFRRDIIERVDKASASLFFPAQLSVTELTAVIAWPLGQRYVHGLPRVLSRQLPAPMAVPQVGRVLGMSNFSGRERPIAMGWHEALTHVQIAGATGVGKTALMANMAKQDMEAGHGLILIEAKGDLYRQVLSYVPRERINDVIVLDVNDTQSPVGFNILRQGDPAVAVAELIRIFQQMFASSGPGVWLNKHMYYGLKTLIADPDAAFTDLTALFLPDDDERAWRDRLVASVREPDVKQYWREFLKKAPAKQEQEIEPVLNRVWPMSRSNLLHIVGQSQSSFHMDEVWQDKKILLVNLSGSDRDSASLLGTVIMNAAWNAAQRNPTPDRPTFLYLDEAHRFMNTPFDVEQMLVESRSRGLGEVLGHQFNDQFPSGVREAVKNSARTKVVFQTGPDDARDMARAFGNQVTDQDFLNLGPYEALARIATAGNNTSSPLSLTTLPPARAVGTQGEVLYRSRTAYGRDIHQVRADIIARRQDTQPANNRPRPRIAGGWN